MTKARSPVHAAFSSPQAGFSLVELLVVVSIISTLIGLLLPAVQAARESGRRTQCANSVRQMAQASQQHVEAQGHFPTGGWGQEWAGDPDAGFGSRQPGGWHYAILPYIDEATLRNDGSGLDAAGKAAAAKRAYEMQIDLFACPTRHAATAVAVSGVSYSVDNVSSFAPAVAGRSDYAANGGDTVSAVTVTQAVGAAATEQDILALPGSAAGSPAGNDRATGLVFRGSTVRPAHVHDGLSNVYLLGERFVQQGHSQTSTSLGNQHGWLVGFDDDSVRFTANAPETDGDDQASGFEGRFGGPHKAGFAMAMADGSVHCLPYDIDPLTHQRLGHRRDGELAALPAH